VKITSIGDIVLGKVVLRTPYDTEKSVIVLRNEGFRYRVIGKTEDLTCHHLNSWD